jgi:hypothetical protein
MAEALWSIPWSDDVRRGSKQRRRDLSTEQRVGVAAFGPLAYFKFGRRR